MLVVQTFRSAIGRNEALGDPREAEIQHLDDAIGPHLDIRRLQIAMNDPALVRGAEGFSNLSRDEERLLNRDRAARETLRQVLAVDKLDDERGRILEHPVDRAMCGWLSDASACASLEAMQPPTAAKTPEHFDRHLASQLGIAR